MSVAMSQPLLSTHTPCESVVGWIMLGPQLERLGMQVPSDIVKDPVKFVTMGGGALAQIGQDVVFCGGCLYAADLLTKRMEIAFQAILDVELRFAFSEAGIYERNVAEYDGPYYAMQMDHHEAYLRALVSLEHRLLHPCDAWDLSDNSEEWWADEYLKAAGVLDRYAEGDENIEVGGRGLPKAERQ